MIFGLRTLEVRLGGCEAKIGWVLIQTLMTKMPGSRKRGRRAREADDPEPQRGPFETSSR
jgi:hypothetical protein